MTFPSSLSVDAYFDLICPWCLIGKRHLETALARWALEQPNVPVTVAWHSYPLMPTLPAEGLSFRAFYVARLGSPEAVAARQAQVRDAAREAGVTLALERIEVMPNTVLAHRLVRFAALTHGQATASALIDDLFSRYFMLGQNIGDPVVLRQAAEACGIRTPGPAGTPVSADLDWLPPLDDPYAPPHRPGLGVPHFVFNGTHNVSGARPADALLGAMRRALAATTATTGQSVAPSCA